MNSSHSQLIFSVKANANQGGRDSSSWSISPVLGVDGGAAREGRSKQRKEGSGVSQFRSCPCLQWLNCLPLDASFQWYELNLPKQCHSWDLILTHPPLGMFKIQNMAVTMSFVLYFCFCCTVHEHFGAMLIGYCRSSQSSSLKTGTS